MSLTDTLITIFILGIIITVTFSMYMVYNNVFKIQVVQNELSANNTIALSRMTKNIRGATRILATANINSIDYTTDPDTLILELPSIDNDQAILSDKFDNFVYHLDPGDSTKLLLDVEPNVSSSRISKNNLTANYVDSINFNYNNIDFSSADKVEIILSAVKNAGGSERNLVTQSTAEIRNK